MRPRKNCKILSHDWWRSMTPMERFYMTDVIGRLLGLGGILIVVSVALACLLLCSCGTPQPDYTTRHGLQVFDETSGEIDRADLEYITDQALEITTYRRVNLRGNRVTLKTIPCVSLTVAGYREMTGSCLEGSVCVWATKSPCFARTAFGHEILHLITWVKTDFEGSNESIRELDRALRETTIADMCGDENAI